MIWNSLPQFRYSDSFTLIFASSNLFIFSLQEIRKKLGISLIDHDEEKVELPKVAASTIFNTEEYYVAEKFPLDSSMIDVLTD